MIKFLIILNILLIIFASLLFIELRCLEKERALAQCIPCHILPR